MGDAKVNEVVLCFSDTLRQKMTVGWNKALNGDESRERVNERRNDCETPMGYTKTNKDVLWATSPDSRQLVHGRQW